MWKTQDLRLVTMYRDPVTKEVSSGAVKRGTLVKVYGGLAVYQTAVLGETEDKWVVLVLGPVDRKSSEVKDGEWDLVACSLETEAEAMKVAEALWERCSSALRGKTGADVVSALPAWVKPWLKRCRTSGKYQEP